MGDLDEASHRGPAYWLRCVIAGTVRFDLPDGVPVIYLPGVSREDLRAIEDCPRHLAPIAELQYRGAWFAHPNGKDWTIRALLSNRARGLGLNMAEDGATSDALVSAFGELLDVPMRRLASQYIDADFLHHLLNPDPVARLLEWLDDPAAFRERTDAAQWKAFVAQCKNDFDFDPGAEGEVTGGRRLGERGGAWEQVWRRFEQSPERYSGVELRLRKGKPHDLFAGADSSWPQVNEEAEARLRKALADLRGSPAWRSSEIHRDSLGRAS